MYRSLENTIKEAMMSADERMAMNRAQMLKKQGKKKELRDFMMAMDMNLRNKVKKSLGEEINEQEDPTNPDTGGAEETEMGKRQLHFIKYAAEEIMDYVDKKGDMDEWFQNKLTTVHDMIRGLHSYIEGDRRLKGMVSEETMELAGVTLQNMEHCPGAVAAFKQNLKDGANEKDVAIAAQAVDAYLAIEDKVKEEGEAEEEDIEKMKALIANAKKVISEKGLKGHTYHEMHLKRVMDMLEDEDEDDDEDEMNELNKSTLGSYIKKASASAVGIGSGIGADAATNRKAHPDNTRQLRNRMKGVQRATDRLTKEEVELDEKAMSQAQQKAAGAALAAKRGEIKPSELVGASKQMYDSMTTKELEDFASTKHKGLPKKVKEGNAEDAMRRKQQMDRISKSDKDKLSKVADMMRKEKEAQAKKEQVNEISDKMKDRYIQKAMGDHQHANAVRKDAESRGDSSLAKQMRDRMNKRNKGMAKAFGEADEGEKAITRRGDYGMEKVRMPDGTYKWKKKPKAEINVEQGINTPAPRPAPKPFPGTKKPRPFGF